MEKEEKITAKVYYFSAYQNGKWGVINSSGTEVIPFEYDEMIIVPDSGKDIFITTTDANLEERNIQNKDT